MRSQKHPGNSGTNRRYGTGGQPPTPNPAWEWMKVSPLGRGEPGLEITSARLATGFFARTEITKGIRLVGHRNNHTSVIRFHMRGTASATVNKKTLDMGFAAIIPADTATTLDSSGCRSLMFGLPTGVLRRAAGLGEAVVFPEPDAIGSSSGKALRDLAMMGSREMARIPNELRKLFGRNLEKVLAVHWGAAILEAMQPTRRPDPMIGRRKFDSLIAWARGNDGDQHHVGDLAGYCGISIRALEKNFRRYFDLSPTEFLRGLRLEKARELLVSGTQTVTEAALDSGFVHLGHFAAAYQRKFGELPHCTAERRAKQH